MAFKKHKSLIFSKNKNIMNTILKPIALMFLFAGFISSCTDDDLLYVAKAPVDGELLVNMSSDNVVLSKDLADETALSFSWNNSDYGVDTPLNYTLEIDTADGDFTNPETVETNSTELSFKHSELNATTSALKLPVEVESQIQVRLKTSLKFDALPSYSKVETISVTPYEDLVYPIPNSGELYLQGDAVPSNWGYPLPENQKLERDGDTFSITTQLTGGKFYAFLSINTGWGDPAYVAQDANQGSSEGKFVPNGPDTTPPWQGTAVPSPASTGVYEITINFKTGKYSVTPQ